MRVNMVTYGPHYQAVLYEVQSKYAIADCSISFVITFWINIAALAVREKHGITDRIIENDVSCLSLYQDGLSSQTTSVG